MQKFTELINRTKEHDLFGRASEIAYAGIFSFFPFVLIIVNIIVKINESGGQILIRYFERILPPYSFSVVEEAFAYAESVNSGGIVSLSILLAVWAASGALRSLIRVTQYAYHQNDTRTLELWIKGLIATIAFAVMLVISLATVVLESRFGNWVVNLLSRWQWALFLWSALRYLIMFGIAVLLMWAIYLLVSPRGIPVRSLLPGAVIAAVGWTLLSFLFSFFASNLRFSLYGTLGGIMAFMLWLYVLGLILLFGSEINAMHYEQSQKKKEEPPCP